MARMSEVQVAAKDLRTFDAFLTPSQRSELGELTERARLGLSGRVVWNINSAARGGGVAEMLQSLLGYVRGAGVHARWLVLEGNAEFFRITKRLHHALHGSRGDGLELGAPSRRVYDAVAVDNAEEYLELIHPGDVVLLHDPQTAGLAPLLARNGALVIWRCHIGADLENEETRAGWSFLSPYLERVDAAVFSRASYVPGFLGGRSVIIPPSIDIFSPKNAPLSDEATRSILIHTGLIAGTSSALDCRYVRTDGAPGRVDRKADVMRLGPAPDWDAPMIAQVARWDPLKDPSGVMAGFARMMRAKLGSEAHLVLAGPNVHSVADDPEAAATFDEVIKNWRRLPHGIRARVHLACLPMKDAEENATIVNALQRHASVVVQKSLQEGFGLTVTEAMWKARPVVASAVGGIRDQIEDEVHGLLVEAPGDLDQFSAALERMLGEPELAAACGRRAHQRVSEHFLATRALVDYARLLTNLVGRAPLEPPARSAHLM